MPMKSNLIQQESWVDRSPIIQSAMTQSALRWFDQASQRERKLLELTLQLALALLLLLLVETLWGSIRELRTVDRQLQQQVELQQTRLAQLSQKQPHDPNLTLEKQRQQLQQQIQRLDQQASASTAQLLSPGDMVVLLESLLAGVSGVELLELTNLEPVAIQAAGAEPSQDKSTGATESDPKNQQAPQVLLWRHGLTLRMKATYAGMTEYLRRLDELPDQMIWQSLDYRQTEYPWGEFSLEVHTLSRQREVLGV